MTPVRMATVAVIMIFLAVVIGAVRELVGLSGAPVMTSIAILAAAVGVRWPDEN